MKLRICRRCKLDKNMKYRSRLCDLCKGIIAYETKIHENEMAKKYYYKNQEKILNDRAKNIDKIRPLRRTYKQNKRKNDTLYSLKEKVSNSIRSALKKIGQSKNGKSTLKYLPYSMQKLKEHIESQFEPWMNWNNQGVYRVDIWNDDNSSTWVWQIDHIIPHSSFNYKSMNENDFKKCWSLENLRPLSAKQNIIKGKKLGY